MPKWCSPKFAIVVALNGEFDLAGGRERELRRQKQDQQWNSGRTGALQSSTWRSTRPRRTRRRPRPSSWPRPSASWTTPRGSRSWRSATRRRPKWPRVRGAVSALGVGAVGPGLPVPGAGGRGRGHAVRRRRGALAVLALWLTWRRPAPDAPQKVNRARGELNAIVLSNPSNSQTVSTQLFLGDKLPVNLPDHWRANLQLPDDGRVDMDLRAGLRGAAAGRQLFRG